VFVRSSFRPVAPRLSPGNPAGKQSGGACGYCVTRRRFGDVINGLLEKGKVAVAIQQFS
jgi:hypothetical protein